MDYIAPPWCCKGMGVLIHSFENQMGVKVSGCCNGEKVKLSGHSH